MHTDFLFFLDRLWPSSDKSEDGVEVSEDVEVVEVVESDKAELEVVDVDESEDIEESDDELEDIDADLLL